MYGRKIKTRFRKHVDMMAHLYLTGKLRLFFGSRFQTFMYRVFIWTIRIRKLCLHWLICTCYGVQKFKDFIERKKWILKYRVRIIRNFVKEELKNYENVQTEFYIKAILYPITASKNNCWQQYQGKLLFIFWLDIAFGTFEKWGLQFQIR